MEDWIPEGVEDVHQQLGLVPADLGEDPDQLPVREFCGLLMSPHK